MFITFRLLLRHNCRSFISSVIFSPYPNFPVSLFHVSQSLPTFAVRSPTIAKIQRFDTDKLKYEKIAGEYKSWLQKSLRIWHRLFRWKDCGRKLRMYILIQQRNYSDTYNRGSRLCGSPRKYWNSMKKRGILKISKHVKHGIKNSTP